MKDEYAKKRVLICEDDRDVAKLLQMMLKQGGYDSDIAYTAAAAKASLKHAHYQAITLDIMLPGQDGLSFLRELQADDEYQGTPRHYRFSICQRTWKRSGKRPGSDGLDIEAHR